MNAKEQMKEAMRNLLNEHFARQRRLAAKNRTNKKRGKLNDRLDEVVTGCNYDPEYTSFGIR